MDHSILSIRLDEITACDLRDEIAALSPSEREQASAYRVFWADSAQPAEVLVAGHAGRAGIADGGDSWWCDAETVDEALEAYNEDDSDEDDEDE